MQAQEAYEDSTRICTQGLLVCKKFYDFTFDGDNTFDLTVDCIFFLVDDCDDDNTQRDHTGTKTNTTQSQTRSKQQSPPIWIVLC